MTVIAFVGSVFSPTYFAARARELAPDPARFCALNVALYRRRGHDWVFTEHPRARVHIQPDVIELGHSRMGWEGQALVVHIDERTTGRGRPVRGTIRLRPRHRFDHPLALDPLGRHHWWPVAPLCEIEVEMEQPGLRFVGSGYHDTNFGMEPLERGFSTWDWSRAELPEGSAVLYDTRAREGEGELLSQGLLFRTDGSVDALDGAPHHRLPRTHWGIRRAIRADEGAIPVVRRTLENTPFYARSLVETTLRGQSVVAMHESLDLDRFAHPMVQRMLPFRMRRGNRA